MWVVEGHFDDGAHPRKLLKPGGVYRVGRKPPAELIIASKTVSQATTLLTVEPTPEDEEVGKQWMQNFDNRPTLTIRNCHEKKPVVVLRGPLGNPGDEPVESVVQPGSSCSLCDGDQIILTQQLSITITWSPSHFLTGVKVDKERLAQHTSACIKAGGYLVSLRIRSLLPL